MKYDDVVESTRLKSMEGVGTPNTKTTNFGSVRLRARILSGRSSRNLINGERPSKHLETSVTHSNRTLRKSSRRCGQVHA